MKTYSRFNRTALAQLPTPLTELTNLSALLGIKLLIKRDDMTGVMLGGNKVRKLEYLLADAKEKGADVIITTGGAQSNHAMLTAACARKCGLECILVLMDRGESGHKGNQILNSILGADVRFVDSDDYDDVYTQIDMIEQQLILGGRKPYVIPVGGSVPLGALGYVSCIEETAGQTGEKIDRIICAAGSGGTHAGCLVGAKLFMPDTKVTGIAVGAEDFAPIVYELAKNTAELCKADIAITTDDVHIKPFYGDGYALPSKEGRAAIELMARQEGIVLDPVYTGKAFAGLIDMLANHEIKKGETVLFLHTGGAGSLFALEQ